MDNKEGNGFPIWMIVLLSLAIICAAIFGLIRMEQLVASQNNTVYRLLTFLFIVIAFAAGAFAIGCFIEDGKKRRFAKSSGKRQEDYKMTLKELGTSRRSRRSRR